MEYYPWQTMIDEYRWAHKHDKKHVRNLTDEQIQIIEMNNILTSPFRDQSNRWRRMIRLQGESVWMAAGRPYYNIHPQMVRSLCKTNLDKIPAEFIEVPSNLPSMVFRFAEEIPVRYADNTGYTVMEEKSIGDRPIYCRSVLFGKVKNENPDVVAERVRNTMSVSNLSTQSVDKIIERTYGEHKDISDFLILCIDEGFRLKDRGIERTLCNTIMICCKPGQSISESIKTTVENASVKEQYMMVSMGDRLTNLLKVIISSGFLANCPEDGLVVPDVLSADRQSFREAQKRGDETSMNTIAERAKRRGKFGYNIGTNEMFAGESELSTTEKSVGEGRELSYSHIRTGHPHAVRYGQGKNKVKIKWFRPTRIRPDLPFKASDN